MVLLEVVAALAILVFAGAVVLGALHTAIRTAAELKREAVAADLAVTLLSRLELGIVPLQEQAAQPFEAPFEDWTWSVQQEQSVTGGGVTDLGDLKTLELVVRHGPSGYVRRLSATLSPPPPAMTTTTPLPEAVP